MECEGTWARRAAGRAALLVLALCLGGVHYWHTHTMFENQLNFSHLSELEREMSLRTEMGFYYSFYKTVAEERPLLNGIAKLVYNRHVEYPKEVNAINRFNIYPEMLIGAVYHYCEPWLNTSEHRACHTVHRGDGLEPVVSCVGLGEPVMFYLEVLWWLGGVTVSVLFLMATSLSGNVFGGILAAVQYLANHVECTRIQWAPNERENFTQPFLIAQMALVTLQLRRPPVGNGAIGLQVWILVLNCICLLFWQFSQFVLLTQIAIFFMMEQFGVIDNKRLCIFLHTHFCGLHMAILLMQGNDMLKTSMYTSFFIVVSIYSLFLSSLRIQAIETRMDVVMEFVLILLRVGIVITGSLWLKNVINNFMEVEEDSHIFDILFSKFTTYKTFHTMLYTCSAVFDFLPNETFWKITKTGLLPLVGFSVSNVVYYWLTNGWRKNSSKKSEKKNKKGDNKTKAILEGKTKEEGKFNSDGSVEKKIEANTKVEDKLISDGSTDKKIGGKTKEEGKSNSDESVEKKIEAKTKVEDKLISDGSIDKKIGGKTKVEGKFNSDGSAEKAVANATKGDSAEDSGIENSVQEKPKKKHRRKSLTKTSQDAGESMENDEKSEEQLVKKRKEYHKSVQYLLNLKVDAGIFYNVSQMVVFGFMAIIIMRLKLLFTPHLCIVSSLATNTDYYNRSIKRNKMLFSCIAVVLASVASYHGYQNFAEERSYVGEYSNLPLEELLTWIAEGTGPGAVFAGPMPLTAAVLLSTGRPIVNHPHYEHKPVRQRTYSVYKTYGKFTPVELYSEMTHLRVTYLMVDMAYCYGRSGRGCSLEEMWDHEVPLLRDRPKLCHRLLTEDVPHFYKVYQNSHYAVFRVHDYSVRYTPRLYAT